MKLLKVNGLNAFYKNIQVLHDISFKIKEGQIVTFLGANGAGKSTLMKAITGTLDSFSGSLKFKDKDLGKLKYYQIAKLGISHVPEGREVFPQLTVKNNLLMGSYLRNDKSEIKKDIKMVYEHFPILKERSNQLAGTMSGGQQQMLAIGRGLMARPELLILDEPSLGLAPNIVGEIYENIIKINEEQNITILVVEQNIKRALSVADYGYILENGKVMFEGTSNEIENESKIIDLYLSNVGG